MSSRPLVLIGNPVSDRLRDALVERYEVVGPFPGGPGSIDGDVARRVDAAVIFGMKFDAAAMDALPGVKIVSCLGTGFDDVDVQAARARNIEVVHGRGANSNAVADLAMGLMLATVRRIAASDRWVRDGKWKTKGDKGPITPGLTGARLGIYGLGEIGKRIARRAAGFEMTIGYHDSHVVESMPYEYHDTLVGLASWCDVLVVSVRGSPSTEGSITSGVLRALGPQGYLINIARGSIVDEQALASAVEEGTIAGAGLDVFTAEPDMPEALRRSDRVVLSPHRGSTTVDARTAMEDITMANLEAFFQGKPLLTPVPA